MTQILKGCLVHHFKKKKKNTFLNNIILQTFYSNFRGEKKKIGFYSESPKVLRLFFIYFPKTSAGCMCKAHVAPIMRKLI